MATKSEELLAKVWRTRRELSGRVRVCSADHQAKR